MQKSDVVIVVDDSKDGWAKAFRELDCFTLFRNDTELGCI